MTIEELTEKDKNFNVEEFISKVDNLYMMLANSVMNEDIDRVKHKLTDKMYEKYKNYILELQKNNVREVYKDFKIKSIDIERVSEDEDYYYIEVWVISKYLDCYIDKASLKVAYYKGSVLKHYNNLLTLRKQKKAKEPSAIKYCPNCGANVDINNNGICTYCSSPFDMHNYDWILSDMKSYESTGVDLEWLDEF